MSLLESLAGEIVQPPPGPKREIVFAIRRDGVQGAGTSQDPYNGSTPEHLDTILANETLVPANTVVRFGPGIFLTRGFSLNVAPGTIIWRIRGGQQLRGAGLGQTTLQLVDYSPYDEEDPANFWASVVGTEAEVADVEISDMTLDANLSRQPKTEGKRIRTQCIQLLNAANVRVRRVRCVNWGTNTQGLEGFPIYIAGFSANPSENVVEDCVLEQPDCHRRVR
jgi:hypothetical protein